MTKYMTGIHVWACKNRIELEPWTYKLIVTAVRRLIRDAVVRNGLTDDEKYSMVATTLAEMNFEISGFREKDVE